MTRSGGRAAGGGDGVIRVALVGPSFAASDDDWSLPAVRDLVASLAPASEVVVFAVRSPSRRPAYTVAGARVVTTGGGRSRGLARLPMLARTLLAIGREHRRRPFDLVHGLWVHEPGFVAVVAARLLRLPVVVSVLGGELVALPDVGYGGGLSAANTWLARRSLAGPHPVTVGSETVRRIASRWVAPERLVRLSLGVDTARFSPPAATDDGRLAGDARILRVGSLSPVKDPTTLLESFRRLARHRDDAHLHLVGDGPLRPELERRAADAGLAGHVTLHGDVGHLRLPAYYRNAHVCVQSSRFESQGMVVLEAASCGVPTVGTRVGILPELVEDRWLTPPGDPAALATVLSDALAAEPERRAEGRRLCAEVRSSWSVENAAASLLRVYRGLLHGGHG